MKKNGWKQRVSLALLLLGMGCLYSGNQEVYASSAVSANQAVRLAEGWNLVGQEWHYIEKGISKTGWLYENNIWYYLDEKGVMQTGWYRAGQTWYYSDASGAMQTGWQQVKSTWYYLTESGAMATGWLLEGGEWYYLAPSGAMQTGWYQDGQTWYHSNASGAMLTGWLFVNNQWYYLTGSGSMAIGWLNQGGTWYYLAPSGEMLTGWYRDGNLWYYSYADGSMALDTEIDGYVLDRNGAWDEMGINAKAALIMDADTGKVLYSKNGDKFMQNASTTKIMTCILVLENCRMDEVVTVSPYAASQEPTKLGMNAQEQYYVRDLLYSLMIPSHNDTAVALAEHVAGSTEAFADMMNAKARELGCTNTNFVTPNGLDSDWPSHGTTPNDLAIIARYALQNNTFANIVNTRSYSFSSLGGRSFTISTTNKFFDRMNGVVGMKTGYTARAGYCFVGALDLNGRHLISVVLNGDSQKRWTDTEILMNYGLNH